MGDYVLQTLGRLLQQYPRIGDIACRIGGEEFVIIMPRACLENGLARAEEIRQKVQEARIRYNGNSPKITISIGIAAVPTHGVAGRKVMLAADKTLYLAKNSGRNRVMLAEATRTV